MASIADRSVSIQTSSESALSTPCWFGEVVLITAHLRKHHVLAKINEQVRFTRRRFGHYEVIDFLAVLFGYAISGERTLEEFYQRLQPFAVPFMALFGRDQLPSRSALSRFLAALTEPRRSAACPVSGRSAQSAPHARQANWKPAGSSRSFLDRLRHRWHAGSGRDLISFRLEGREWPFSSV